MIKIAFVVERKEMCIDYVCSLYLVLVGSEKSIRSSGADVIGYCGPPGADAGTQFTSSAAAAACMLPTLS